MHIQENISLCSCCTSKIDHVKSLLLTVERTVRTADMDEKYLQKVGRPWPPQHGHPSRYLHCKKLKVVLTLLWLFELQIEYTIATAGKYFRDKHRAMSNLASENHHPLMI